MSGLFVNYFECSFQKDNYNLKALNYSDYNTKESYVRLRDTHKDLAFTRDNDKVIYWALENDATDDLNGQLIKVRAGDNPRVFLKVFETSLIHRLYNIEGYRIRHDSHSHVWRITAERNLLDPPIDGLALHRQIGLNSFYRRLDDQVFFGVVISTEIEHRFTWGKQELDRRGIDTSGLNGKGDIVFVNRHALKQFLAARGAEEEYEIRKKRLDSNEQRMATIDRFFSWICKSKPSLFLPDGNQLTTITKKYLPFSGVTREVFPSPKRFYFGGRPSEQTGLKYNEQVKKYKPYSFELFDNKPVNIGILCPQQFEGVTESFITKLENLLRSDLHLQKIRFSSCYIKDSSEASYKEKLYDPELLRCNIILIVVTEEHVELPPQKSPYYFCKAKYIGNGIPTQDVQVRNIKNPNSYILNNIALNIYAKLGGTAWTVEKEEKRKQELIIGIGSTTGDDKRQVMGIAQVFNSDGRYLVGDCVPLSNFENYSENLRSYLWQALNKIIEDHINTDQEFRLIFHLFKSASSRYEIQAITSVINQYAELSFKYALVHLGYGHNFRLFNDDGKQNIARGTYVKLEDTSALLHFIPNSCVPLYIQLDRRSTFQDLYYLSKQVYWFSHLSHRSYMPAKKTVTITYPSLMAALTEKLKQVDGWDYDRLKNVAEKLWFI